MFTASAARRLAMYLSSLASTSQGAFPHLHRSVTHTKRTAHLRTTLTPTLHCPATAMPVVSPARTTLNALEPMDFVRVAACASELQQLWVPSKVEGVVLVDKDTLALRLRSLDRHGWLYLSWHPTTARVCIGGEPDRGEASEAFPIAKLVSSRLNGQVLTAVTLPVPFDRVVQLDFAFRPGEPPALHLMCEVQGRYSNVLLTTGSSPPTTLVAARQIGDRQSTLRHVQVGAPYTYPPQPSGIAPSAGESFGAWRDNVSRAAAEVATRAAAAPEARPSGSATSEARRAEPVGTENGNAATATSSAHKTTGAGDAQADVNTDAPGGQVRSQKGHAGSILQGMLRAYQGVSSSLARELLEASLGPGAGAVDELADGEWEAVWVAWGAWVARVESGSYAATRDAATGRISVIGGYDEAHESVHTLIDKSYRLAQAAERFAVLKAQLTKALATADKKLRGKLAAFARQLSTSYAADACQKQGDLIMANIYQWPAGQTTLEVDDWDTGKKITVELADPDISVVDNAKVLYKKAGKQRRAGSQLEPLVDAAEQQLLYLEEVAESLAELDRFTEIADLRAIQEIQDEMVAARVMKAPTDAAMIAKGRAKAQKNTRKRKSPAPSGEHSLFRKFDSPSGLQILIGRNNTQNDELSTRIANGNDVWMHARGIPGSHLIIRVLDGKEATDEDLQFAANLSVYYSRARESGRCDVAVCRGRHVKKPRGANPGQVMILKEQVRAGYPDKSAAALQAASS